MRLTARLAETPEDAEQMRLVRNEGVGGFTGDNRLITEAQQAAWWRENRRRVRAWLYIDPGGVVSGYGLLRPAGGRWWFSFAVAAAARGKGVGTHIAGDVPSRHRWAEIWSLVRGDNAASLRAHQKAGVWQWLGEYHGHVLFSAWRATP